MAQVDRTPLSGTAVEDPPQAGKPPRTSMSLPLPPARTMAIGKLLEWWQGVPQDLHPRLIGYLYRYDPRIILPPKKHAITIYSEPPESEEQIYQQWGWGEYGLQVSDNDKKKNAEVCFARFKDTRHWSERPPVLDYDTLDMEHKDNRSFIQWSRSVGKLPPMTPQPGAASAGDSIATAALKGYQDLNQRLLNDALNKKDSGTSDGTRIAEMYTKAHEKALDMVSKQSNQSPLADTLAIVDKVAALVTPKEKDTSGDNALFKMIIESQNKNFDMMVKLIEARQPHKDEGGFFGNIEKFAGAMVSLREVFGGQPGGSGKWFDSPFVGQALGVADKFVSAIPFMTARRANPMTQQQQGQQPQAYQAPATVAPGLPAAQSEPQFSQQTRQPQQEEDALRDSIIQLLTQIWVPMLQHLNGGARGEEFCDYVCAGWPFTLTDHAKLKEMGRDKLVSLIKAQPAAWAMLSPIEAQFTTFFDQFLAWYPGWAGDDNEDEDEPPPPGPAEGPVDFRGGK